MILHDNAWAMAKLDASEATTAQPGITYHPGHSYACQITKQRSASPRAVPGTARKSATLPFTNLAATSQSAKLHLREVLSSCQKMALFVKLSIDDIHSCSRQKVIRCDLESRLDLRLWDTLSVSLLKTLISRFHLHARQSNPSWTPCFHLSRQKP